MDDQRATAEAILSTLLPGSTPGGLGLVHAIRSELLVMALQDASKPGTLGELLRVLERLSVGGVGEELLTALRERARREPYLRLRDLAGRAV